MFKRRKQPLANEEGQSIVIVALFLFFVFLVFAALATDGTLIYLHRRNLQNIADSAALTAAIALAQDKADAAGAYQKAMDSIATNGGHVEWYSTSSTPNPPTTNDPNNPSGVNLVMGIEITGECDVRVALRQSDIGTFFAQFVGRQFLEVGANARASCNRGGGLTPIAVKRFGDERDWNLNLKNTNNAKVYCDMCNTQKHLHIPDPPGQGKKNATEFLRPESTDIITGTDASPHGWPEGTMMYKPPATHASRQAKGREHFMLGDNVVPGVGTTSYGGIVNLDIRHVSAPPVEYFNGVTAGSGANVLKDLAEKYIRQGYDGSADIPVPGEQVAIYNGSNTSFAAQAMLETYDVGEEVAVIVYNGHVLDSPNWEMTGEEPNYKATRPISTTVADLNDAALQYTLTLSADPAQGFKSAVSGIVMDVEGLDGFADWSLSNSRPVLGHNGIYTRTVTLSITPKIMTTTVGTTTQHSVITGTRMFYVKAHDSDISTGGTDAQRYWAGVVTVGDYDESNIQRDLPAVTGTPTNADQSYPFIATVAGQQAQYKIDLDLWGSAPAQTVTVTLVNTLPTGIQLVGTPVPGAYIINDPTSHPGNSFVLNFKTDNTVAIDVIHEITLQVSGSGLPPQTFKLYILVEAAVTTTKEYVEILGYAVMEITGYYNGPNLVDMTKKNPQANGVRGRIVSELKGDPNELTHSLRARLIPWDM